MNYPTGNIFSLFQFLPAFIIDAYDRVVDSGAPNGTRMVGPVMAALPVNIGFLGRPFSSSILFRIAPLIWRPTNREKRPEDSTKCIKPSSNLFCVSR